MLNRLTGLFAFLLLGACTVMTPDNDRVLEQRVLEFNADRERVVSSVHWYTPKAIVKGGAGRGSDGDLKEVSADAALADAVSIAEASASNALLVWHRGRLLHEQYWNGAGPSTRHMTFSFHKTVMGLLTGVALDEGFIANLDQPVSDVLSEWADDPRGALTLRQVMQMSGGIGHPSFEGGTYSVANKLYFGSFLEQQVLDASLVHEPGKTFDYGNTNAQIMGLVLDRAFPNGYTHALSEYLWKPISAHDATVRMDRENGLPVTYCCLNATARDWLKIGLLIKNRGEFAGKQVVSAQYFVEFEAPAPTNPNYGLFLWRGEPYVEKRFYSPALPTASVVSTEPFFHDDVLFLDGSGGQRLYVSRGAELIVIRLGKTDLSWDDTLLYNAVARSLPEQ